MAGQHGIPKHVLDDYRKSLAVSADSMRIYLDPIRDFSRKLEEIDATISKASAGELRIAASLMNEGLSPSSSYNRCQSVRRFLSWYSASRGIADLSREIEVPDFKYRIARKELTADQVDAVLKAAAGDGRTETDLADNLVVNLMLRAALRPIEIHNANVSDVLRAKRGQAILRIKEHGSSPESYALLTKPVVKALNAYLAFRMPEDGDPLVTSASTRSYGERLSERSIREKVQNVFKRAGIPGTAGDYSLRHTAIYMTMRSGANAEEVQQLARLQGISSFRNWEERVFLESDMAAAQRLELAMEGHEIRDRMCVIGAKELQEMAQAFREGDELIVSIDMAGQLTLDLSS